MNANQIKAGGDPALCDVCRQVSPYTITSIRVTPSGEQYGYYHRLFEDLEHFAQRCTLCSMILVELNRKSHPIRLKKGKQHQVLLASDKYHSRQHTLREVSGIVVRVTNSNAWTYLRAFAEEISEAASSGDVIGRPLFKTADSPEAFRQIREWVDVCTQNHQECNLVPLASEPYLTNRFPSRLLDVGTANSSIIRLVDRLNALGDYVALSYCWGSITGQLRTLTPNLAHHMLGIEISNLPLTLRDAVIATRNIGLRYLWIDALCIIQDDKADWMREAPHMGLIYQNAHLTLAATGSSSSTGGLFRPRDLTSQPAVQIAYRPPIPSAASPRVFSVAAERTSFDQTVTSSVWNTRGWVLQERNLSRRIVLFAAGQTFFECVRHSVGEGGSVLFAVRTTSPLSPQPPAAGKRSLTRLSSCQHQEKRLGSADLPRGYDWAWCGIVEDYTARNLTYGEDRLFAIQGMAANFMVKGVGDFCAGLAVGKALPLHLMWYPKDKAMEEARLKKETSWTKRAPTWSWAALEGPVGWETFVLDARVACAVQVINHVPGLAPDDCRVREAELSLRGLAVEVVRSRGTVGEEGRAGEIGADMAYMIDIQSHPTSHILLDAEGKALGWGVFDRGGLVSGPFIAAVVSRNEEGAPENVVSLNVLILKDASSDGSNYVRVGMGQLTKLVGVEFKEQYLRIS